jgi:hypothetical protein
MKNLIKQYIKELLFENSNFNYSKTINYLKKKYEGKISKNTINFLIDYAIEQDPSADKIYSDWILREYVNLLNPDQIFFESFSLGKLNNFLYTFNILSSKNFRNKTSELFPRSIYDINFHDLIGSEVLRRVIFFCDKSNEKISKFLNLCNYILPKFYLSYVTILMHYLYLFNNTTIDKKISQLQEDSSALRRKFILFEKYGGNPDLTSDYQKFMEFIEQNASSDLEEKKFDEIKNIITLLNKDTDYSIVYESDSEILLHIKSVNATCKLGEDSFWCVSTSTKESEPTNSARQIFDSYSNDSFIFFYMKKQEGKKSNKYLISLPIYDYDLLRMTQFKDLYDNEVVINLSNQSIMALSSYMEDNLIDNEFNDYIYDILSGIEKYTGDVNTASSVNPDVISNLRNILRKLGSGEEIWDKFLNDKNT